MHGAPSSFTLDRVDGVSPPLRFHAHCGNTQLYKKGGERRALPRLPERGRQPRQPQRTQVRWAPGPAGPPLRRLLSLMWGGWVEMQRGLGDALVAEVDRRLEEPSQQGGVLFAHLPGLVQRARCAHQRDTQGPAPQHIFLSALGAQDERLPQRGALNEVHCLQSKSGLSRLLGDTEDETPAAL